MHRFPLLALVLAASLTLGSGARALGAEPSLAVGVSHAAGGGPQRWRLSGRTLTVRLPKPLAAGPPHRRVDVRAACGEAVKKISLFESAEYVFADGARRLVRAPEGARTLRFTFGREVATRATRCVLYVGDDYAEDFATIGPARMSLERGTRPSCQPGSDERVVARGPHGLVTRSALNDGYSFYGVYRWCEPPAGPWHPLDQTFAYGGGSGAEAGLVEHVTRAGDWLAWTWWLSTPTGPDAAFVRSIDLGAPSPRRLETRVSPLGTPPVYGYPSALALAPDGTTAWTLETDGSVAVSSVQGHHPGGPVVTLDSGPWNAVSGLTLSPDGTTASWTNAGVARTATLP